MSSLLDKISSLNADFSRSERRVAAAILAKPHITVNENIAELAKRANVSEPTVYRFCKTLGTEGFPDFKNQLQAQLSDVNQVKSLSVGFGDSVEDVIMKVVDSTVSSLRDVQRTIDTAILARAIDHITQAHRIVIVATGLSSSIGYDFYIRLLKLGISCEFISDITAMLFATTTMRQGDLLVAISSSGKNNDIVITAINANQSGASVISICPDNSPLSEQSSIVLKCPEHDVRNDYLMTTRVSMQIIGQVILAGVFLRRSDSIKNLDERMYNCQSRSYIPKQAQKQEFQLQEQKEQEDKSLKPNTPITPLNFSY